MYHPDAGQVQSMVVCDFDSPTSPISARRQRNNKSTRTGNGPITVMNPLDERHRQQGPPVLSPWSFDFRWTLANKGHDLSYSLRSMLSVTLENQFASTKQKVPDLLHTVDAARSNHRESNSQMTSGHTVLTVIRSISCLYGKQFPCGLSTMEQISCE